MKHAVPAGLDSESLVARLVFLGWPDDDPRWEALAHFLRRVRDAGLALVSRRDRDRLVERHLISSLEALSFLPASASVLDVGSGGGFPAVPLAFAKPGCHFALVESNERKSEFLTRVSRETGLRNLQVIRARAGELGDEHHGKYDLVTARAVGGLADLIVWTSQLLADGGRWVLWKGQRWRVEGCLPAAGVRLLEQRALSDGGRLVILEKVEGP